MKQNILVYLYSKCSTCKAALLFLKEHNIAFTAKEIAQEPPSIAELQRMLDYQNGNLKKLFNTSGLLYKEMNLKDKLQNFSTEDALKLLSQHGMLVKRPFLLSNSFGLVGFNKADWAQALGCKD